MKKGILFFLGLFAAFWVGAQEVAPAVEKTSSATADEVIKELQQSVGGSGEEVAAEGLSFEELLETGGPLLYVLFAMSLLGLAMTFYFFVTLRSRNFTPPYLYRDIASMISSGRLHDALETARKHRSPSAMVARAGLEYVAQVEDPDVDVMGELMEGEGARQATAVVNQTQYLMDIGVIAPMVGLLGTVVGMLKSFNAVSLNIAQARPMELAAGVSQALVTTAAGLMVGIPAMIAYAYFRGRASRMLADMEIFASNLRSLLVHRKDNPRDSEKA